MKLASYNVENLFERVAAMNLATWEAGKPILDDYVRFNDLIAKPAYSAADRAAMLAILGRYPPLLSDADSRFFVLRENRGRLRKLATANSPAEITAAGRGAWIGWLERVREPVNEAAITNTARLIAGLDADVIGLIEAEDRPGLRRFNELVIGSAQVGGQRYRHAILIDGNDERGIDVGLLSREDFPVEAIRSHADERTSSGSYLFSRDCASYRVRAPSGALIWVLVNHLKSKGYGSQASSNARRRAQARRVREIYDELVAETPLVAVIGDLNDTADNAPLAALTGATSPLRDVSEHDDFDDGGRPGTYANCAASQKIDYILCSPDLFDAIEEGGIDRRGVWGGAHGTLFPHLPTIHTAEEAASDHAAIWADFDV